jgi:hypothetical protein
MSQRAFGTATLTSGLKPRHGAPAMTPREFASYQHKTIVGISLTVRRLVTFVPRA